MERSKVGTKKSRQPKRQQSLELVQSRQSLTTVRQEVLPGLTYTDTRHPLSLTAKGQISNGVSRFP